MLPDPQRHLLGGDPPAVWMSARIAALLDRCVLDRFRREQRGLDAELDATLTAIRVAAMKYADHRPISAIGNAEVPIDVDVQLSDHDDRIGTTDAAKQLGLTTRQVVNLADVLRGRKVAGRWTFHPQDVDDLRQRREGA